MKCRKCHKFKRREHIVHHERICVPTNEDITYYNMCKGGMSEEKRKALNNGGKQ